MTNGAGESGKAQAKPQPASRPRAGEARRAALIRAVFGLGAWGVCLAWFRPTWEMALLWFGILALVPIALSMFDELDRAGGALLHHAARLQPAAALLLVAAWQPETRTILLAIPWIVVTGFCGLAGVERLVKLGLRRPAAAGDVGLIYFMVSGAWAGASVAEWPVFGLPPLIALLTVVHQTYAGLIFQTVAGKIAGRVSERSPHRWMQRLASGLLVPVSVGNMGVATGIVITAYTGWAGFEFGAVCLYASSVIVLGWFQLYVAFAKSSGLPAVSRVLLVIADLSLGTALTLAIIFAWGTLRGYPTLVIPQMITWHGTLNALGFGACGLLGWWLAKPVESASSR
jgi:hypothetical protein